MAEATPVEAAGLVAVPEEEELPDDPLEVVEEQIRRDTLSHAKTDLQRLMDALNVSTAPRVLRLVENIAEHHREMLATLKLGEDSVVRKKKYSPFDDTLSVMSSSETFGAQAITQIGATLGDAFRTQHEGRNIDNLISAIATAKDANLDHLVPRLERKLDRLLGPAEADEPLDTEEALEEEPPEAEEVQP
jgi:HPt (histidine-containing phosphotransfer) domain-containing protein